MSEEAKGADAAPAEPGTRAPVRSKLRSVLIVVGAIAGLALLVVALQVYLMRAGSFESFALRTIDGLKAMFHGEEAKAVLPAPEPPRAPATPEGEAEELTPQQQVPDMPKLAADAPEVELEKKRAGVIEKFLKERYCFRKYKSEHGGGCEIENAKVADAVLPYDEIPGELHRIVDNEIKMLGLPEAKMKHVDKTFWRLKPAADQEMVYLAQAKYAESIPDSLELVCELIYVLSPAPGGGWEKAPLHALSYGAIDREVPRGAPPMRRVYSLDDPEGVGRGDIVIHAAGELQERLEVYGRLKPGWRRVYSGLGYTESYD